MTALNGMIAEWAVSGVDVLHRPFAHGDAFTLFIPPADGTAEYVARHTFRGGWNATTNAPLLASAQGVAGDVYRVVTAGSVLLDGLTGWAVDDWLTFDGAAWRRGQNPIALEEPTVTLLAARIAPEYGMPVNERAADLAWRQVLAMCIRVPRAGFDASITSGMQSRRHW